MRCVSGSWSAAKHELRGLGDGEKGARHPTHPPSRLVNVALPSNCSIFPNSCRPAETAVRRCPPLSSLLAPNLPLFSFLLFLLSFLLPPPPTCSFAPKQFSARSPGARSSPRPYRPNRNRAALSSAGFASRKPTQAEGDPWARLAFRHAFRPCATREPIAPAIFQSPAFPHRVPARRRVPTYQSRISSNLYKQLSRHASCPCMEDRLDASALAQSLASPPHRPGSLLTLLLSGSLISAPLSHTVQPAPIAEGGPCLARTPLA